MQESRTRLDTLLAELLREASSPEDWRQISQYLGEVLHLLTVRQFLADASVIMQRTG